MPVNWPSSSSGLSRWVSDTLEAALRFLAQPRRVQRLRQALLIALAIWAVMALSQLLWSLLPGGDTDVPDDAIIINPVGLPATRDTGDPVDIARMQGWHLFGEAGSSTATTAALVEPEPAASSALEGIERGARETRLAVKLRGVVASSEEGLGYAVIEYQSQQDIYAVEDKLPLPGRVLLAKVMPRQVVLDNGGTYELLELFEESGLDTQLLRAPTPSTATPAAVVSPSESASTLAQSYRERLYQNPQSLAEVVNISAVRENGELLGYRVAPGKEQAQFELLGFRQGDLVTSVNGIELNDPANTLRLYQTMRTAGEAVFNVQRDNLPVTISVNLGAEVSAQ